jgi:uncharacterized protein YdcH (DUF465 family)
MKIVIDLRNELQKTVGFMRIIRDHGNLDKDVRAMVQNHISGIQEALNSCERTS